MSSSWVYDALVELIEYEKIHKEKLNAGTEFDDPVAFHYRRLLTSLNNATSYDLKELYHFMKRDAAREAKAAVEDALKEEYERALAGFAETIGKAVEKRMREK